MNTRTLLSLLLLGFATSVPAAFEDDQPTTEEAHAFLGGTFQRYAIAYANARQPVPTRAGAYGGDGCVSQLGGGRGMRPVKVNWSNVYAVDLPGGNAVDLLGTGPLGNLRVHFPNERAARSAAHAFEVLRSACVLPALTARR